MQGKKYNADEEIQPIEVTIGGKVYEVREVTEAKLNEVIEIGKAAGNGNDVSILSRQLALLVDADPSEFVGIDVRKLMGAVNFIQQEITASAEGSSKKA